MKVKILLTFSLLLPLFYACNSSIKDKKEQATTDSIKKYADLALNDTIDFNKRVKYNDKAYALIDDNINEPAIRSQLSNICYSYCILNKTDKLSLAAHRLQELSLKYGDSISLAKAYRHLGLYYMALSNNEKAIEYFFKAKKIFLSYNEIDNTLKVMGDISIAQAYASDFLGSNKTAVEILKLAKKTNNSKHNFFCFVKIGNNLGLLNNNTESIKYFKKAENYHPLNSKSYGLNNNMASSLISMQNYDEANRHLKANLDNKKLFSVNPTSYAISFSLSAYIQLKQNHLTNLEKKFNLAEKYFVIANSESGRNYNQSYMSMYYEKIGDTSKAIEHAQKAVDLSKSYKNPTDVLICLNQLIKVDKKNASAHALEYIRINDSLQVAERNFRDKFARIAYETDEISQQKDQAIHQNWLIGGLASILLLIVILILIITYQRGKQKEVNLLREQQQANEEIYNLMLSQKAKEDKARQIEKKRIALELHDGIMNKLASTRLNLSILSHNPDKATIEKCINYINDIYTIEQEIRTVSHELNQDVFKKEESFIKLLQAFVQEQNQNSTTHYELELDADINWDNIPAELKMHLYRIIQEASHNINKHAQAANAIITFTIDEPNICMAITDDGKGINPARSAKGIGIQNMKVRVKSLKGKFSIKSTINEGTAINMAIPIK